MGFIEQHSLISQAHQKTYYASYATENATNLHEESTYGTPFMKEIPMDMQQEAKLQSQRKKKCKLDEEPTKQEDGAVGPPHAHEFSNDELEPTHVQPPTPARGSPVIVWADTENEFSLDCPEVSAFTPQHLSASPGMTDNSHTTSAIESSLILVRDSMTQVEVTPHEVTPHMLWHNWRGNLLFLASNTTLVYGMVTKHTTKRLAHHAFM